MPVKNSPSRKLIEYGIYITILIICITLIYWRFWYRPAVEPVVMIDPASFTSKGQALPTPMLDPGFTWSLVQIVDSPPMAIFKQDGTGKTLTLKIGDEVGGWEIQSIQKTMVVVVNAQGDRRSLFYSSKPPKH